MKDCKPTRGQLQRAFHEVKHSPPKAVIAERKAKGPEAAKSMGTAIALSKARAACSNKD